MRAGQISLPLIGLRANKAPQLAQGHARPGDEKNYGKRLLEEVMTKEPNDLIPRTVKSPVDWLRSVAALLMTLLLASSLSMRAHAQAVSATLVGTIADSTGAGVPGAKITITEMATGIGRNTVSNESGNYTFPDLTPGTYSVVVLAQGFKKEARPSVDVVVNTPALCFSGTSRP